MTTVFGSGSAPANFDGLPETITYRMGTLDRIPEKWIFRQLDDVPFVSPGGSGYTAKFAAAFERICRELWIPLAEMCPNRQKAFGTGTTGTVLGVAFDTESLSWSLAGEKVESVTKAIDLVLRTAACDLLTIQKLHGKLNDFAQMLPFAKGFRFHLLEMLCNFED